MKPFDHNISSHWASAKVPFQQSLQGNLNRLPREEHPDYFLQSRELIFFLNMKMTLSYDQDCQSMTHKDFEIIIPNSICRIPRRAAASQAFEHTE